MSHTKHGVLYTIGERVIEWNIKTGSRVREVWASQDSKTDLVWASTCCTTRLFAAGTQGVIRQWNCSTGNMIPAHMYHGGCISALSVYTDKSTNGFDVLFSGDMAGEVRVWDGTGICLRRLLIGTSVLTSPRVGGYNSAVVSVVYDARARLLWACTRTGKIARIRVSIQNDSIKIERFESGIMVETVSPGTDSLLVGLWLESERGRDGDKSFISTTTEDGTTRVYHTTNQGIQCKTQSTLPKTHKCHGQHCHDQHCVMAAVASSHGGMLLGIGSGSSSSLFQQVSWNSCREPIERWGGRLPKSSFQNYPHPPPEVGRSASKRIQARQKRLSQNSTNPSFSPEDSTATAGVPRKSVSNLTLVADRLFNQFREAEKEADAIGLGLESGSAPADVGLTLDATQSVDTRKQKFDSKVRPSRGSSSERRVKDRELNSIPDTQDAGRKLRPNVPNPNPNPSATKLRPKDRQQETANPNPNPNDQQHTAAHRQAARYDKLMGTSTRAQVPPRIQTRSSGTRAPSADSLYRRAAKTKAKPSRQAKTDQIRVESLTLRSSSSSEGKHLTRASTSAKATNPNPAARSISAPRQRSDHSSTSRPDPNPRPTPNLDGASPLVSRISWMGNASHGWGSVSYTHLRAHETPEHLVCRLLLEKKKKKKKQ
eukprot:TRINITY_DN3352_c0_g1_i5.p1 TRINITY_DN3352_c0_g1~~TRINITY_DN3352_c0_g1_i5.p1  ORF type:complete len:655 (+),score=70.62 TRINITY_DN3352_c0_g1_i5:78-2042(+)